MDREALVRKYDEIGKRRLEAISRRRIYLSSLKREYVPPTLEEAGVIYSTLVINTSIFLRNSGLKSVLVPVSGGADSTLVLKLCQDASRKLLEDYPGSEKIRVVAFTLPQLALQEDNKDLDDMGSWAAELYADVWSCVDIAPAHRALMENLLNLEAVTLSNGQTLAEYQKELMPNYTDVQRRIDRGNVAARIRMIFAYGVASMLGGAQPSTDNFSEGLTGFWTLCGDEGTFKLIQSLWKGLEQPQVMWAAGIPSPFIFQKETDGLGVGNGDVAQMYGDLFNGTQTYADVDEVLMRHLDGQEYPDTLFSHIRASNHPICQRHDKTEFKRNPFVIRRDEIGLTPMPTSYCHASPYVPPYKHQ